MGSRALLNLANGDAQLLTALTLGAEPDNSLPNNDLDLCAIREPPDLLMHFAEDKAGCRHREMSCRSTYVRKRLTEALWKANHCMSTIADRARQGMVCT